MNGIDHARLMATNSGLGSPDVESCCSGITIKVEAWSSYLSVIWGHLTQCIFSSVVCGLVLKERNANSGGHLHISMEGTCKIYWWVSYTFALLCAIDGVPLTQPFAINETAKWWHFPWFENDQVLDIYNYILKRSIQGMNHILGCLTNKWTFKKTLL
jgi:hypothetical protein